MPRYVVMMRVGCDDAETASQLEVTLDAARRLSAFTVPTQPHSVFVRTDVRARTPQAACDKGSARLEHRLHGAAVEHRSAQRMRRVGFLTWASSSAPGDDWDDGGDRAGDRSPVG